MVASKINTTIGFLHKLQNLIPRSSLLTIYKAFVRPHLDHDIIYDEAYNASFHQKLEKFQYNACLAMTGAIRGTSKENFYQEFGFKSFQLGRWYRKLCSFYKICKNNQPTYFSNIILQ